MNQIADGAFCAGEPDRYGALVRRLYEHDYFLVTPDFEDYYSTQRLVDKDYTDGPRWARMAIMNTSKVGWFSSDRTIAGYARDIWNVEAVIRKAGQQEKEG